MTKRIIAFDTETHLIEPGLLAPPVVCLSYAHENHAEVLDKAEGEDKLLEWLLQRDVTLVGHNVAYDFAVYTAAYPHLLPSVFEKYFRGEIICTQVRQKLIDIGKGEHKFRVTPNGLARTKYDLATLSDVWLNEYLEKTDTWRLRYSELDGVPLEKWPEAAIQYAKDDAKTTLRVYQAQEEAYGDPPSEVKQNQAAWALHLMAVYGLRTDPVAVGVFKAETQAEYDAAKDALTERGFIRTDGTKDMGVIKAAVDAAYNGNPPRTKKDGVKTDSDTLLGSNDPDLVALGNLSETFTNLNRYIPMLEKGTEVPINPRWNVLVETGRTSCGSKEEPGNFQNLSKKGRDRECFIPREGFVYAGADLDTAELRAWSQVCIDLGIQSPMADALRRGDDVHLILGADILGIPLEEAAARYKDGDSAVDAARQTAKKPNFGRIGGMGPDRLVVAYAEDGIYITRDEAVRILAQFDRTWNAKPYFDYITSLTGDDVAEFIVQVRSKRIRGHVNYMQAANGFFQGLIADAAKDALWEISKECYTVPSSDLYGSRPVLFLHDEIILEVPKGARGAAAAARLAKVMVDTVQKWMPDVPVTSTPSLFRRWWKSAKPVFVDGQLVPSKPLKGADGKTKWVHDEG